MINNEIINCPNCNNKFSLEYFESPLGSLGYNGSCQCGKEYFLFLGSLELRFNTDIQNKKTINEMLQIYINENKSIYKEK